MRNAALAASTTLAPPPDFLDLQAANARLTIENDELRARLELLTRELCGNGLLFPVEWRLTTSEAKLLALLIRRQFVTKEQALVGLYNEVAADHWPEIKIVDVFICKLRRKLKEADAGFEITTLWGRGHTIEPTARAALAARFEPAKCQPIRGFNS